MELYILEGFKNFGNALRFTAEDDNGKTYNVEVTEEDFSAYFETEIILDKIDLANVGTEFNDAAEHIANVCHHPHTSYDCQIIAQKLIGYRLYRKKGGSHSIAKDYLERSFGTIANFMKKETGYSHFTPVLG